MNSQQHLYHAHIYMIHSYLIHYLHYDVMLLFYMYITTFRISNWLVTGIKFWSDQDGKIVFTPY